MMEKISEILKKESEKSNIQRLRERKKSIPVVMAVLYFSAFFIGVVGKTPLDEVLLFVSLVLVYYILFIMFSPLSPYQLLYFAQISQQIIWIFFVGASMAFISAVIFLFFEKSIYLVAIFMFGGLTMVSFIPIPLQVFWSRTLAKIKNDVRKPLADSLLLYLPVTLFLVVALVSIAFLLLPPVKNYLFYLILIVSIIVTFFIAIEIPFYVGAKRDRKIKIRNLEQKQKNLTNEFHDSKRTNQKFDKLLDMWLKEKEISRIKSEPLHPYIRSWKMFVTIFYLLVLPIIGIFVFEFLRGFI